MTDGKASFKDRESTVVRKGQGSSNFTADLSSPWVHTKISQKLICNKKLKKKKINKRLN